VARETGLLMALGMLVVVAGITDITMQMLLQCHHQTQ
jgi:hypothetical protein